MLVFWLVLGLVLLVVESRHLAFYALFGAAGAFAAALLEALPLPLDDNLWIPVASGLVLTALRACR